MGTAVAEDVTVGNRTVAGPIEVSLIGGFELAVGGRSIALPLVAQRLVAYLALQSRPPCRMHVAGVLWPESSDERAMRSLRSTLWRLRRLAPVVETIADSLRLPAHVRVDARDASSAARQLLDGSLRASDLPGGIQFAEDLLPDWYDDWVLEERERFRQLRLHALERLCERLAEAHSFGQAVDAGLAAVAAEPLRESAHRALIRAHLAEGNPGEAVRQYRRYERLLQEDLGLPPSREIRALIAELAPA